jgi:hypothetical protein
MSEYGNMEKAIAGQKFGLNDETETYIAGEDISPGDPLFAMIGETDVAYKAHVNAVKLTASAALVAENSIAPVVNGIAVDPVLFQNSSPETFRLIAEAINLNDEVRELGITAFIVEGDPLSFYLSGPGITITASATVTGGASQASFTSAAYTSAKFVGVARHMELSYKEGTGFYPAGVPVNVMTYGKITVPTAAAAAPDNLKPAYVILTGTDAGTFTDDDGAYDTGCLFRSDKIEGNIALIEVRGIK